MRGNARPAQATAAIAGLLAALGACAARAEGDAPPASPDGNLPLPYALRWPLGGGSIPMAEAPPLWASGDIQYADPKAIPARQWRLRLDAARSAPTDVIEEQYDAARSDERTLVHTLRFRAPESDRPLFDSRRASYARAGDALRWELAPSVYFSGGRLVDDDESQRQYQDIYAGVSFDVAQNAGLSVGYQHLRQALGGVREGEANDPEALFLRFELRF